jgi:hypothetical protein
MFEFQKEEKLSRRVAKKGSGGGGGEPLQPVDALLLQPHPHPLAQPLRAEAFLVEVDGRLVPLPIELAS